MDKKFSPKKYGMIVCPVCDEYGHIRPPNDVRVCEAPRPQGGASRKGNFVHIVPLDPAYKAGLAGHVPAKTAKDLGLLKVEMEKLKANG